MGILQLHPILAVLASALRIRSYAPVGQAARRNGTAAAELLATALARHGDDPEVRALAQRMQQRRDDAYAYTEAYRRHCWDVEGVGDLRLAPFHLLASEGAVHHDKPHAWYMNTLAGLARHDDVLAATPWRTVERADEAQVADAVDWWNRHTEAGGEGMVVKPETFLAWHEGRLVQPALKVRGREYLRIIYGPEYLSHLERLRGTLALTRWFRPRSWSAPGSLPDSPRPRAPGRSPAPGSRRRSSQGSAPPPSACPSRSPPPRTRRCGRPRTIGRTPCCSRARTRRAPLSEPADPPRSASPWPPPVGSYPILGYPRPRCSS